MAVEPRRKYSPRLPRKERREQLLDAALGLISEHGFTGISMEAVAREADIAKTVVYDAFGNQSEMLKALFEREQERVLAAIADAMPKWPLEGEPAEILAGAIRSALAAVQANPDTWRLILLPADGIPPALRDEVNRHRELLVKQVEPMAQWGQEQMGLGSIDAEITAYAILAGAEDAARMTLTYPDRFTPERIAKYASDLLTLVARGRAGRSAQ